MMVDLVAQLVIIAKLLGDIALLRPVLHDDRLLVDGGPVLDLILELVDHKAGIRLEVAHNLARQPTAITFNQCPRQVVVVERHDWFDAMSQQLVD